MSKNQQDIEQGTSVDVTDKNQDLKNRDEQSLSKDELQNQETENLPEREEMSLINANLAAPVNAAVAANVLSDDAVAYANAEQTANIDQST